MSRRKVRKATPLMPKNVFLTMGAWAIHRQTGVVRHKLCNTPCHSFNKDNKDYHDCNIVDDEASIEDIRGENNREFQRRHIPAIVRDTAKVIRETHNEQVRREIWQRCHPGKPYPGSEI